MIPKFESHEERAAFLAGAAGEDGVYLRVIDGVPCCVVEPKPCLNQAMVVHIRMIGGVLRICASPCAEHAAKVSKLYE